MATKGIHVNVYKLPDGTWRCDLKLNTNAKGEGITVRGTSDDSENVMGSWWSSAKQRLSKAGQALAKSRMIAKALLSNPAVAAAFPQYVIPALATLEAMEKAERRGLLSKVKQQFKDPTLKKLARELDEMSKGQRNAMSGGGVCLCDGREPRVRHTVEGQGMWALTGAEDFPWSKFKPSPFGNAHYQLGPFGLPQGNPHPFAEAIREQIAKGVKDPLELQKLARMHDYQRRMARAAR